MGELAEVETSAVGKQPIFSRPSSMIWDSPASWNCAGVMNKRTAGGATNSPFTGPTTSSAFLAIEICLAGSEHDEATIWDKKLTRGMLLFRYQRDAVTR